MRSKPTRIDSPVPDPAAIARMQEIARTTPVKPSRSKLAPFENSIFDLLEKGRTFEEICEFLGGSLGTRPSTSTLHHFVHRAKKRRAKERALAQHGSSSFVAPSKKANHSPNPTMTSRDMENNSRGNPDAIRALKARVAAAQEKPTGAPFTIDPLEPL